MQCASCTAELRANHCVSICCVVVCHECHAADLFLYGSISCPSCRKILPLRNDQAQRASHALNELMTFFQLGLDDLPLYHREIIKGSHADAIFIRLQQLKYDKRRIAVLHSRLKTETSTVRKLEEELRELQAAYDRLRRLHPVGTTPLPSDDSSSDGEREKEEMWPDGKMRRIGSAFSARLSNA